MWTIYILAHEQHADSIGTTFSRPRGRDVSKSSMVLHEQVSEHGGAAKLPFDLEKTIVLGNPLASTKRACFNLPTGHGYDEVGYERVFGIPRSMRDDITPSYGKLSIRWVTGPLDCSHDQLASGRIAGQLGGEYAFITDGGRVSFGLEQRA